MSNKKLTNLIDGSFILNSKDFLDTTYSRYDIIRNCIKIVRKLEKEQRLLSEPINKLALRISKHILGDFDNLDNFLTEYYHNNYDHKREKSIDIKESIDERLISEEEEDLEDLEDLESLIEKQKEI